AEYRLLLFGALLLAVLWLAPEGVVGTVHRLLARRRAPRKGSRRAMEFASPAREALEADNLSIAFGGVRAASGISLEARPGAITSLIGPNGAGKTTVLNMLGGFYRPDAGAIRVGGKELEGRAAWKISRAGVARTYQTTQLFGSM